MPLVLPVSAYLSAKCWKNTVIVLTNIVSTCPAAAIGIAIAIPAPIY
jgi:hypothetical protein